MVPPVPTPQTRMSTRPSVSSQISGPVVRSWMPGFAGFSNCRMSTYLSGSVAASSSARAMAPFIPCAPGVSTRVAPKAVSTLRRSMVIVSGMVSTHL